MGNTLPSLVTSLTRIVIVAVPLFFLAKLPGFTLEWIWWLAALSNVAPSLLLDRQLFDFRSLRLENTAEGDEDSWFDQDSSNGLASTHIEA